MAQQQNNLIILKSIAWSKTIAKTVIIIKDSIWNRIFNSLWQILHAQDLFEVYDINIMEISLAQR